MPSSSHTTHLETTYLETIARESRALAATLTPATLAADVTSCPGWDLADLAAHLGWVQRWARLSALTQQQPDPDAIDPAPGGSADDLAAWIVAGADALVETLAAVAPDTPTWHPFPVPLVASVWPRRQAHEVTIHRWDAQAAAGTPMPLDPDAASDFVSEYVEVVVPRVVARDGRTPPQGDLALHLTDTDVHLYVHAEGTEVSLGSAPPATSSRSDALAGTAEDVLLALWRRRPLPGAGADPGSLAAEWLAFGGN